MSDVRTGSCSHRLLGCLLGCLPVGLLLAVGCGDGSEPADDVAGVYLLDRTDYARALVRARHPPSALDGSAPDGSAPEGSAPDKRARAAREETIRAARKVAAEVSLRVDLALDGTFVVSYRFPKERGTRRGAWQRDGATLTLRITHDAAGPIERGAVVRAEIRDEGLRISGWPVPNAFLLRRQ